MSSSLTVLANTSTTAVILITEAQRPSSRQRREATVMNDANATLDTAERLIREQFPEHFGTRHSIDRIVGSSFSHENREVNYITVHLAPGGPPLDHLETIRFNILLKEMLTGCDIHNWPAIAFNSQEYEAP